MKKFRKILLTSLGLLPLLAPNDLAAADTFETDDLLTTSQEMPWSKSRILLKTQTGSRSIAKLDAMIPLQMRDNTLYYANLMTKLGTGANNSNGDAFEANIGGGFRYINNNENAIYGAYTFFDIINTVNDNTFQQVTVGVERLGLVWDFRANAYLPIGTTKYTKDAGDYKDPKIDKHDYLKYTISRTETSQAGGDIEVGHIIGSTKLRGYVAAYSFGHDITGARARVQYQLHPQVQLTAMVQHDQYRGTQYLVGANFTFGGVKTKNTNNISSRLMDEVVRDIDVVTKADDQQLTKRWKNKYFEVDPTTGPGGTGTQDDPFGSIEEAVDKAPEGADIILKGDIDDCLKNLALRPGQQLFGMGKDIFWSLTPEGKLKLANEGPGNIIGEDYDGPATKLNCDTINCAQDSGIFGIELDGTTINVQGTGVELEEITLNGGLIAFQEGASGTLENVTTDNSQLTFGNNSSATLSYVTLNNSNGDAIVATNADLTTTDLAIVSGSGAGISQNGGSLTMNGQTTISNTAGDALLSTDTNINNQGDLSIDGTQANGTNIQGGSFHSEGKVIINNVAGTAFVQSGGTLDLANDITTNNNGADGIHLDKVDASIGGNVETNGNKGRGLFQEQGKINITGNLIVANNADSVILRGLATEGGGSEFIVGGVTSITGSAKAGFEADGMSTISLGDLTIDQQNSNIASDALSINGGTFSARDIKVLHSKGNGILFRDVTMSGDNVINSVTVDGSASKGVRLKHSDFNVKGDVNILNSVDDGYHAEDMAGKTATFGNLTIHQADAATGKGFYQSGGNIQINGDTDIKKAVGYGAFITNVDFNSLGDITISLAEAQAGTFANAGSFGFFQEGGKFSTTGEIQVTGAKQDFSAKGVKSTHIGIINVDGKNNPSTEDLSKISVEGGEFSAGTIDVKNLKGQDGLSFIGVNVTRIDKINIENVDGYGINLNDTTFNAVNVIIDGATKDSLYLTGGSNATIGTLEIANSDSDDGRGIYLNNSNLTVSTKATITGSKESSFVAENMSSNNKVSFNNLTINQGNGDFAAFTQTGGTVNLNGKTNISGPNTIGIKLGDATNINATGQVTISDSTNTGFKGFSNTEFNNLTINLAKGATNAFEQAGGNLTINGTINLNAAAGETADTAFNLTDLITLTLGNVNIGVDAVHTGSFANGINIDSGKLLSAGDITINNIAETGTAINLNNVAMNDDAIAGVDISGNQKNGVVLSGSDFRVANATIITGSTVSSFSATDMTAGNTTSFGSLDITQSDNATNAAFTQTGGTVELNGTTNISGSNTIGIKLGDATNINAIGQVTISDSTNTGFEGFSNTEFNNLTINLAKGATNAFEQAGGNLTIHGTINLNVAAGDTAGTAFNLTDLITLTLGNVNIGVDAVHTGSFANGINIDSGKLLSAGDIKINNIATAGTAIQFNDVTMNDDAIAGNDDAIAGVDISGNQKNGVVLSGSDFRVANATIITGSTDTGFSATNMTGKTTTLGDLTISLANKAQRGFYQNGGHLAIEGQTIIDIVGVEDSSAAESALGLESLDTIRLGNVTIDPQGGGNDRFKNGIFIEGTPNNPSLLLKAGKLEINGVKKQALVFNNVSMPTIDGAQSVIQSITINSVEEGGGDDSNAGITLTASDLYVDGDVQIKGIDKRGYVAEKMGGYTTSIGGKFTIISTANEPRPKNAFEQDGGNIFLGGGLLLNFNYNNVTSSPMNIFAVNLINTSLESQGSINIINNGKEIERAINLNNSQINMNGKNAADKNITISGTFDLGIALVSNSSNPLDPSVSSVTAGTLTIKTSSANDGLARGIYANKGSKITADRIDITADILMQLYENASVTTGTLTLTLNNGGVQGEYTSQEAFNLDLAKGQYADSITRPDLIHLPE